MNINAFSIREKGKHFSLYLQTLTLVVIYYNGTKHTYTKNQICIVTTQTFTGR